MLYFNICNGLKMPALGLGTWQATSTVMENALNEALKIGYRHIDTANQYENETAIGNVLAKWLSSGKIKRKELFITTKLPPAGMYEERVEDYLNKSLHELRLDYVDLYLMHSPQGIREIPQNREDVVMDDDVDHIAVWRKLEQQVRAGKAKAIGVANFEIPQIENLLKAAEIKPSNLQTEIHLYMQQKQLVDFCKKNSISVVAYSPLGSPGIENYYKECGRDFKIVKPLENTTVKEIAEQYGRTPAQILLRHTIQRGIAVIPKSANPKRMKENFNVFDFNLDEKSMELLNNLDMGSAGRVGFWEPWTWV